MPKVQDRLALELSKTLSAHQAANRYSTVHGKDREEEEWHHTSVTPVGSLTAISEETTVALLSCSHVGT